jgi:hypothetical protein
VDKDKQKGQEMSNAYWDEVTNKINEVMDIEGSPYIHIWDADDIILDGSFDVSDLETIARMVKEAKEKEPK